MQNMETGKLGWRDMHQYECFRKISEEEEVYLGNFDGQQLLESKIRKIELEEKQVYKKVRDARQKVLSTRWIG